MTMMKQQLKRMYQVVFAPKIRGDIARLGRLDNWAAPPIAEALSRTFAEAPLLPEEQTWMGKIETLRREISASTEMVTITAYGAGSPEMNLTEAQMREGRIIERSVGETARGCSQQLKWALLLHRLLRGLKCRTCVELGTCLGVSGAYQASALQLNGNGRLITMEGAAALARLSEQHFAQLGLDNTSVVVGRFADTLPDVLEQNQPIDYAYIDGHHDEQATIDYFEQFLPYLDKKALLIFDDINWSEGMRRAWQVIESDARVRVAVNLRRVGLAVIDETIKEKHRFHIIL